MKFKPHGYQQTCINRILNTPKLGLFLDMGLGKTITTLTAVKILHLDMFAIRKVLVIAPKKVAEGTWSKECEKWDHTRMLRVSLVLGSQKQREAALHTPADIYITNRENVVWLVNKYKNAWPFDMVVIDESSSFKSHSAKRFKALAAVMPHVARTVLLTGTPSPNSLQDLWSQIYLLDGGARLEDRFTKFRSRYFDPALVVNHIPYSYTAKPGAEKAIMDKISDICVSMKAEDYLELPEIIYDDIPVELTPTARKNYKALERQMVLELADGEDITATSAAALSNKLLQLSNGAVYDTEGMWHEVHNCKIDAFMEIVESLKRSGQSALVFYQFRSDLDRLTHQIEQKKDFKWSVLSSPADEENWNSGRLDVLFAHPASAAYGLNLQQGGHHVIWFGLTWNYEQYVQANARLYRQGQEHPVMVHHLICSGTRDADVIRALGKKDDMQQYVLQSLKERIKKVKEEL